MLAEAGAEPVGPGRDRHRAGRPARHRQEPGGLDARRRRLPGGRPGRGRAARRSSSRPPRRRTARSSPSRALLTTTMTMMKTVIDALEKAGIRKQDQGDDRRRADHPAVRRRDRRRRLQRQRQHGRGPGAEAGVELALAVADCHVIAVRQRRVVDVFREHASRLLAAASITARKWSPPAGSSRSIRRAIWRRFARDLLADPRIGWISITDNPGGGPMLPPDWLAGLVAERRGRVVVHLTCKDMNRNGLEAAAWRYASEGFDNILALTGDYPTGGFGGLAEPVFDLDSVGLITLLAGDERRAERARPRRQAGDAAEDQFLHRLRRLALQAPRARADAAVFQARAQDRAPAPSGSFRSWATTCGSSTRSSCSWTPAASDVPVVGNVYLLSKGVAKLFNSGKLAGCVVSDELLQTDARSTPPGRTRARSSPRVGRQAIGRLQGAGLRRRLPGRHPQGRRFGQIIDLAESYGPDDWRRVHQGDPVLAARRVLPLRARSADRPERRRADQPAVSRFAAASAEVEASDAELPAFAAGARLAFTRDKALYGCCSGSFARWDKKPGFLSRMAYRLERVVEAGDVRLPGLRRLQPARLRLSLPASTPARSAAATGPAAARPTAAASWTTRNASGPGSTSG